MHTSAIFAEQIHRENVPAVWIIVRERLSIAIENWAFGEYDIDDLFDSLITGRAQLWIVNDKKYNIRMIGVTRILKYPKKKRLLIDVVVGEGLDEILTLIPKLETWMQQFGATETEAHVRPALARILENRAAFKRSRVVLFREPINADLSETQRKLEQG